MTKVIVIDDQPLEGKMIEYILHRDCPFAKYGGQAFTAAAGVRLAEQQHPDIIFLDITMPEGSGISVIENLKQVSPHAAVVMLTAHDNFEYIQGAMRAGANDYLLKPTRPSDVSQAVYRWSDKKDNSKPIDAAKRYVEQHLGENISLSSVAEILYLSPAYFSRLFHRQAGCSFSEWLTQRRMDRARNLLRDTTMSVSEIAASIGFKEPNSFTRLFKKSEGVSPTEYRRAYTKELSRKERESS